MHTVENIFEGDNFYEATICSSILYFQECVQRVLGGRDPGRSGRRHPEADHQRRGPGQPPAPRALLQPGARLPRLPVRPARQPPVW